MTTGSGREAVCARCGQTRRTLAGVCPTCGYDRLVDATDAEIAGAARNGSRGATNGLSALPFDIKDWPQWLRSIISCDAGAAVILHPVAWIVLPSLFALLFGGQLVRGYQQWPVYALILALVPAAIIYFNWKPIRAGLHSLWPVRLHLHWGWVMVGLAIALRLALHQWLPLNQPVFEETETGKHAFDLVALGHHLQLEYRFTNLFGAFGFLFGDYTIESLRTVFRLAGGLSILVMALMLRRLAVSWPVTLLVVFSMASLRLLVLANGMAWENYTGLTFEILLLYFLVGNYTSKDHPLVWAGFAGIFGGILMYEFIAYKPALLIAPVWWLWQALRAPDAPARRLALLSAGCFVLTLTFVALPVIYEIVTRPVANITFSGVGRNIADSNLGIVEGEAFHLFAYLRDLVDEAFQYVRLLFGFRDRWSGNLHHAPDEPIILPLVGIGFAIGFVYGLWRPAVGGLTWIGALSIVCTILVLSFIAAHFLPSRVIAAVPLLLLMFGLAADRLHRSLGSLRLPLFRNVGVCIVIVAVIITLSNVWSVMRMASAPGTVSGFDNGPYNVCRSIGNEDLPFQRVYANAPHSHCDAVHLRWLYPDVDNAQFRNLPQLPDAADLSPGTLVVIGNHQGLSENDIAEFLNLAAQVGSLSALRAQNNLQGNLAALTFCHQCDAPAVSPPLPAMSNVPETRPASLATTAAAVIDPDPATVNIRVAPTEHHLAHLVSSRSAVIIPYSAAAEVVLHNNADLLSRDGCKEPPRTPEGDTRMLLILPEADVETRLPFYLVGCRPGEVTLDIMSEGELLNTYTFTVAAP